MALVVTFRLPVESCALLAPGRSGPVLQEVIKQTLLDGMRSEIPITETEVSLDAATERFNLSVPEDIGAVIRGKANELGVTPRHICQGVLLSSAARLVQSTSQLSTEFEAILAALRQVSSDIHPRPEQSHFYDYLMDSLQHGLIGLCEAGTGTGKTLAMLAAAKRILDTTPDTRLVLACPSIMLMEQFARQYDQMVASGVAMPVRRIIIGRREFVSPSEVLRVANSGNVDAEVDVKRVLEWVASGGHADNTHWFDQPWLASSLAKVAPGFPVAAAILPDAVEENDPGLLSYQSQFDIDDNDPMHEILLCTHSMLAVDTRRRMLMVGGDKTYQKLRRQIDSLFTSMEDVVDEGERKGLSQHIAERRMEALTHGAIISADRGFLPPFQFVLIDEAHVIEQAFSNALSNYVSLKSFLSGLNEYREAGGKISAKSLKHVAAQLDKLVLLSSSDTISLSDGSPSAQSITDILKEVSHAAAVVRSIRSDDGDYLLNRLKRELRLITAASERYSYSRAYAKFSPVRAFPQLFVGAPSVDNALSFLWSGCRAAVCVSATLYLPRSDGFSAAYQAGLMATPKDRMREYPPVVPEWTFTTVEGIYFPESRREENGSLWLRPVTRSDKLNEKQRTVAEQQWIAELADAVARIYADSAGGVLVLMTSYSSINQLTNQLPVDLRGILIAANRDTTLATQRKRFLTHVRNGKKPLWLAVGGAWTGLDVGGHKPWAELFNDELPAEQDNVLTTLIIPRLPFGTNKTITHMTRLERNATVPWEVLDVFFRTKQAIGRLVRRGHLPANRRIYILDGRINDPDFGGYLSRIRALVKGYPQKLFAR